VTKKKNKHRAEKVNALDWLFLRMRGENIVGVGKQRGKGRKRGSTRAGENPRYFRANQKVQQKKGAEIEKKKK